MNEIEMEDMPKIRVEFALGTKKLKEAVDDMIRQAIAIKGTRFHAAVALGISPATIINHLGPGIRTEPRNEELARSESANLAGAGHGVSPPSSPGGEEKQDSGVRSQDSKAGDGHDG